KVPWWNSHLQILRTKVRKLERRAFSKELEKPNKENEKKLAINQYKIALTNYTKEIRKAKKHSWRTMNEEIE
ncbi:unnamed protein product, partial [Sphagnum compactum]